MRLGKKRNTKAPNPSPDDQPILVDGWQIYFWDGFRTQLTELEAVLQKLRTKNPNDWHKQKPAKFILRVFRIILEEVPRDPANPLYRQGRTIGKDYKHWRRVKFASRFRLFFRYSLDKKIIVFVWLNDENTQRKEGARTDVYSIFKGMLMKGWPPNSWSDLLAASNALKIKDKPK